jgi:GntR family transcriptional regulator
MAPTRAPAAYRLLAGDLRTAILKGRYEVGAQLPTEADLVEQYRVSRQTVRRAFHDLVAEGMVERIAGRGTFVAPRSGQYLRQFGSIDDLMALSTDTDLQVVTPLRRRVDIESAGRFGLGSDAVHTVVFVRRQHRTPFCVSSVHLPPDVASCLADVAELATEGATTNATVIGLLDDRLGSPISEAEQSVTASGATGSVAQLLACEIGAPLLRIDRMYRDATGQPVELAVSYFLPELYSYRVRLRRNAP